MQMKSVLAAGVEVRSAMRALDYLETRPEVDKRRIGLTGISGGGAMTWYTAAVHERVAAAAPVCSTFTFGFQAAHWIEPQEGQGSIATRQIVFTLCKSELTICPNEITLLST